MSRNKNTIKQGSGSKTTNPSKNKNMKQGLKTIKPKSGSKTSKPLFKVEEKYKPERKTMKKTVSGSKTANPKSKNKNISDVDNSEVDSEKIDINKIFDIIDSETKRKETMFRKEKEMKKVVGSITNDTIKKSINKKVVDVSDHMEAPLNIATIKRGTEPISKLQSKSSKDHNIDNVSKMAISSYLEAKQFLKNHNITISTITLDCKLHTLIDVDIFAKNVTLKEDEIVSVKFGNRKDPATNRTIVVLKTKKKPSVKNFYNQVTILMKPMNNPERNYINIKVFKNGSLQMTGCKDMDDFNNVTTTLIKILKRGRDTKNKKGKSIHMDFIDNPKEIGIFDIKIRMINSNFKLDYKVDRKKLAKLLKKNHGQGSRDKEIGYVECKYEPTSGHSCVNIKYRYDDKNKPSIFVFQTGAIIITGAKNLPQIIMAYHFIHKILNKYFNEIRIIDLDHKAVQAEIAKFFKNSNKNKIQSMDC